MILECDKHLENIVFCYRSRLLLMRLRGTLWLCRIGVPNSKGMDQYWSVAS